MKSFFCIRCSTLQTDWTHYIPRELFMVFSSLQFPCLQLSTFCRRRPSRVPPKDRIFLGPQFSNSQITVIVKSFSSTKSPSGVCRNDSERSFAVPYLIRSVGVSSDDALSVSEKSPPDVRKNDSEQTFTVSYLINSCGLSSDKALSVSKKLRIKSPEKSDAVLKLLRNYGFEDSHISRLVFRRPSVLSANPEKTLLPKLEFFCSFGVPLPALAETLSFYPDILGYNVDNYLIPWYNCIKSVVQSDKKVVFVFWRGRRAFKTIPLKIAFLRQQGLPQSSIAALLAQNPSVMYLSEEKLGAGINLAVEMGFDKTKLGIIRVIQVFAAMSESTLKHKLDVYRSWGWSDSDINTAFQKDPFCMKYSEKKINATMDFLVNKMGIEPVDVARRCWLLCYSVDKRTKPRCLVAGILSAKGLRRMVKITTLLGMTEEVFLKKYIVDYQDDIPLLLDLYRGKVSLNEMGFNQDVLQMIQI